MFGNKKKDEKSTFGNLIEGLPVPQNTELNIKLTPDAISLIGNGQDFEINISKIQLVDVKSDVEMEKIIKQSAPGMVIGAATFGIVGAMIGGKVKTKEKRVVSHFLIINYNSDELKSIVLNVTEDWHNAAQLVDYFKKLKPNVTPIKVEL